GNTLHADGGSSGALNSYDRRKVEEIRSVLRCCSDMHIRGEEGVYAAILEPIVYETATWHNPTLSTQFLQTFIGEFISMGLPGNPALLIGDAFLRHSLIGEAR
ncbi:MAG TPA: hypothetical protein PKH75_14400, partial [Bacillota bacterium]|nr:hypothetical protein [Bacillota bacterium]